MAKHEVIKVWKKAVGTIEKIISYKTEKIEYQEVRVKAEFEGDLTPEKIKQISEVVEKAAEEIGKIVEEW